MLILRHLDHADARAFRAYRLQVKERLYRFNYVSHPLYIFQRVGTQRLRTGDFDATREGGKAGEARRNFPERAR